MNLWNWLFRRKKPEATAVWCVQEGDGGANPEMWHVCRPNEKPATFTRATDGGWFGAFYTQCNAGTFGRVYDVEQRTPTCPGCLKQLRSERGKP